jgi:hypothetical protein
MSKTKLPKPRPKDQPEDAANDATNPGRSEKPRESYSGRPDQGLTRNLGPGAGGATEWGGGNKNHPSHIVKPGPVR